MAVSETLQRSWSGARAGVVLLVVAAVARFLMLPVFGVAYDDGTTYTSLTILFLVVAVYSIGLAVRTRGMGYLDLLGILVVLTSAFSVLIALGILVDDVTGIETYYTDPAHGGEVNTALHMVAHLTGIVLLPVILWIPSAVLLWALGRRT